MYIYSNWTTRTVGMYCNSDVAITCDYLITFLMDNSSIFSRIVPEVKSLPTVEAYLTTMEVSYTRHM